MSIRNATIAMRRRKIGLFEQERIAFLDEDRPIRRGEQSKLGKKDAAQVKPQSRHSREGALLSGKNLPAKKRASYGMYQLSDMWLPPLRSRG